MKKYYVRSKLKKKFPSDTPSGFLNDQKSNLFNLKSGIAEIRKLFSSLS